MKKNVFGKKFGRDTNERRALFKSLMSSLVLNERIQTTEAKAKAIKGSTEKAVTRAKKSGEVARRLLGDMFNSAAMDKLINDIAPRFKNRNGGYTRIIRVGKRFGDNAMEVVMEWTEGKAAVPSAVSRQPRVERAAHQTKSKTQRKSRSLSEGRQSSSAKKTGRTGRPSVAARSGRRGSAKKSK